MKLKAMNELICVFLTFFSKTLNMGAVAGLRRIKNAISVARHVLHNTEHSMIVGDLATQFALEAGFVEESLSTTESHDMWTSWKQMHCQPNFRTVRLFYF